MSGPDMLRRSIDAAVLDKASAIIRVLASKLSSGPAQESLAIANHLQEMRQAIVTTPTAAAEPLLTELREATRLMVNHQADEFGPRENWPVREQIERQEAAIAKAEGRS